jgi:hypothetical protein
MDVKFNVVLNVLIENFQKNMFPRHGSTLGNLAQKQGKFIPMGKTSDIKKQFVSTKD